MQFDNSRLDIATLNLRKGRYAAAFEIFFELATNDFDQEAQFALTKMCFDGHLDPEQINKLFTWVNSNSSLGNGYAHFNVGLMHERGMGEIKQDYKTAIEYYEKAVKEEVHDAYCNLGNIYALGLGEEQGIPGIFSRALGIWWRGPKKGVAKLRIPWAVCMKKGSTSPRP
jgi:uncharacterized protein